MDKKSREITLWGTIVEARDYNPKAILGDLPTIKRSQEITIKLEPSEHSWKALILKDSRGRVMFDESQLHERT